MAKSIPANTPPIYMLVCNGKIQFLDQATDYGQMRGLIYSTDYNAIKNCGDAMAAKQGRKIVVAKIGTIEGETLESQLLASIEQGANVAWELKSYETEFRLYPHSLQEWLNAGKGK